MSYPQPAAAQTVYREATEQPSLLDAVIEATEQRRTELPKPLGRLEWKAAKWEPTRMDLSPWGTSGPFERAVREPGKPCPICGQMNCGWGIQ